jgi:hypothetical protein
MRTDSLVSGLLASTLSFSRYVRGSPLSHLDGAIVHPLKTRDVWQPQNGQTYQIILHGVLNVTTGITPNVDIYDLDLFYTPAETFQTLHQSGKKVICYFSAGTSEDWRPDWSEFQASDKGSCLGDWSGEAWLNINSDNVWNIMSKRIELASQKGCDGIDPDNMGKPIPIF